MLKKKFIALSILLSIIFWISESFVHSEIFEDGSFTLLPTEPNEAWMRSLIFILMIVFGFIIQKSVDKEKRLEREKLEVYLEMIKASNHILNNFLQNMYAFKLEADDSRDFDKEVLSHYNDIIQETKISIRRLEGLVIPTKSGIEEKYRP